MYIPPFTAGVITVLNAELFIFLTAIVVMIIKNNSNRRTR